jgi:hypothetical protein
VFQVAVGHSNFPHSALAEAQAVSPGSSALSVTVTNSDAAAAQLVMASGGDQVWTVSILAGQARTASTVAAGGIAFDALSAGGTVVDSAIAGFAHTAAAQKTVNITP